MSGRVRSHHPKTAIYVSSLSELSNCGGMRNHDFLLRLPPCVIISTKPIIEWQVQ
jgi:hypothetical protein